jgi:glycosyltransferase involved in cell wall biosynthesis
MRQLSEEGWSVMGFGGGGDGYDVKLLEEGFRFTSVPISRRGLNPLGDLRLFQVFRSIFRRERPAVVHTFTIKPAIYATLAAWRTHVPVRVVTITGLGHAFMRKRSLLRTVVEQLYRFALSHADVVFFQNREDLLLFVESEIVEESKTRLVAGSGVDLTRFQPEPLPSVMGTEPSFLMIARLLREKGIAEYVQAATRVKARHPDVRFILVGGLDSRNPSGLTRAEFEILNAANAIEWIGEVEDVRPYIKQTDIMVLPSYREGVPRSLLEGAAMGRALLATDAVGCREVVTEEETGFLVPIGDVSALANRMETFIHDPALVPTMGQKARRMCETRFDERVVISQTISAYNEILSRKTSHAPATPLPGTE